MKENLFILLALIASISACAYDFMVDGLCYDIIDGYYDADDNFITGKYAEVTYQNGASPRYNPGVLKPNLLIPATVAYNGVTYKVREIGEAAFSDCSDIKNLTIAEGVERIKGDAFWGCSNLEKVTLPNSLTYIGQGVFNSCSSLTSVTMSSNIETIEDWSFENCKKLSVIDLPERVSYIGVRAFENCYLLTRINAYFDNPEDVEVYKNNAFKGVPKNGTLHVKKGCKDAFEHNSPWSAFYNIIDDLENFDGIEEVCVDELDRNLPMEVYNLNGVKVSYSLDNLPSGIYIARQGSKSAKVVK